MAPKKIGHAIPRFDPPRQQTRRPIHLRLIEQIKNNPGGIAAALAASVAVAALPTPSFAVPVTPPAPVFGAAAFPWPIFACVGGIITSALVANARDHRELTAPEAWSCGVLFWFAQPKQNKRKHR